MTQYNDFTKAFFDFKMSHGFTVHKWRNRIHEKYDIPWTDFHKTK